MTEVLRNSRCRMGRVAYSDIERDFGSYVCFVASLEPDDLRSSFGVPGGMCSNRLFAKFISPCAHR